MSWLLPAMLMSANARSLFVWLLLSHHGCHGVQDLDDWLCTPPYPVIGLPLVPLQDGSLATLCAADACLSGAEAGADASADPSPVAATPVFYVTASQQALLQMLPELLLDTDVLSHEAADECACNQQTSWCRSVGGRQRWSAYTLS